MPQQLETDYLIIGTGAMGMAFADVLLSETDANIIIKCLGWQMQNHANVMIVQRGCVQKDYAPVITLS